MSLDFFLGMFPKLLHGTWITLVILLLSGLIGNALAVGVALARVSKIRREFHELFLHAADARHAAAGPDLSALLRARQHLFPLRPP
jgi:ABC-type arginine/histidine transport system, permease component